MMTRHKFNPALLKWLEKNAKNYTTKELMFIINTKFNETFDLKKTQQYLWHHNITHIYEQPKRSHSNQGLPIGSERTKADGMIQVKVGRNKWEYKQRMIYEKAYGKLPKNMYVIFLDQNRNNFELSNLKAVTAKEAGFMANQKIFSKNPDITSTGVLATKVHYKAKEIKNGIN